MPAGACHQALRVPAGVRASFSWPIVYSRKIVHGSALKVATLLRSMRVPPLWTLRPMPGAVHSRPMVALDTKLNVSDGVKLMPPKKLGELLLSAGLSQPVTRPALALKVFANG